MTNDTGVNNTIFFVKLIIAICVLAYGLSFLHQDYESDKQSKINNCELIKDEQQRAVCVTGVKDYYDPLIKEAQEREKQSKKK